MFKIKIATVKDIETKYSEIIKANPNDYSQIVWKEQCISSVKNGSRICYYGYLNDNLITEGSAIISYNDKYMQNKKGLVNKTTAYLTAFKTNPAFENKGYFSLLYNFIENDLKQKGFKYLTLGVEPMKIRNMQIYFHYGFTEFVKLGKEYYPSENKNEPNYSINVLYYKKTLI